MTNEIWLAASGLLVGIVGIIIAVIETRKYRGPLLSYQYHGSNLILGYDAVFPETIEVSFGGEEVPNLTHSQVVVWNRGRAPIRGDDVSSTDPLFLKIDGGGEILQAEVVKISKESNLFSIDYKPRSEKIGLNFDFLDNGDGVLLSVWHTGREIEPIIDGTLIHGKAGPFKLGRFLGPRPNLRESKKGGVFGKAKARTDDIIRANRQILPFVIIGLGLILTLTATISFLREYYELAVPYFPASGADDEPSKFSGAAPIVFGLLYSATGCYMWSQTRRRFPKELLPKDYSTDD